jgi:hypothetical protein
MYWYFLLYCKHKGDESPRKIRRKRRKLKRYETTYTIRGNTSCLCTQDGNEHPSLPCRHHNESSLRTALPAGISFPPCSQTQRCAAADHGGMRDLKLSQRWSWRFKSPETSRRVSSTRRPGEFSCLYYVGHYSPKERLSLPKRTRVYTEWCRHTRNVPQVFANQWRYHGIDPLTTNPFARKHCVHTTTDRLLFDNMAVYFHNKKIYQLTLLDVPTDYTCTFNTAFQTK